jgi:signal transduction histidine kinase
MQQAAAQIDALIQDLLDVTRLEAAGSPYRRATWSRSPLVEAALYAMHTLAESRRRRARTRRTRRPLPMVHADPDRVTQLLSNLVGNALKFTPAGGRVEVRVQRQRGVVLVSVIDTARAFPPTSCRTCSIASSRCRTA